MSEFQERLRQALEGRYEIDREIGRGGMGVVYLGRDIGLDRPVAIKVLPDHLAGDPERLERFEREAKLLATLNHPNIAGIYGIEESEERHYLILEYVEGETLADRLERSPLSVKESLRICRDIAGGVEAAHEKGVIHRDLKPGNVRITPDDEIKVLDFGLAKGTVRSESSSDQVDSPTLTFQQATGEGVILGTTSYLSPEQARGKSVNRRADIWAFGCVLFECLTGKKAFAGETSSDTIAQILERDIDLSGLPANTPNRVREFIHRCLEKEEKNRIRDIGDARIELEGALAAGDSSSVMRTEDSWIRDVVPVSTKRGWARASVFTLVGAVLASAVWILAGLGGSGSGSRSFSYVSINTPKNLQVQGSALSHDGRALILRAREKGGSGSRAPQSRMYVRPIDSFAAVPIAGTEGVQGWDQSPDGKWLVYFAPLSERSTDRKLYRVPIDGSSPPVAITDWNDDWGRGLWLENGDFLINTNLNQSYFIFPGEGGPPGEVTKYLKDDPRYRLFPISVLPNDRGILLNMNAWRDGAWKVSVGVLDLESGETKVLIDEGGNAKYSPTGHLLYSRADALLAVSFDLKDLEVNGSPLAVMNGLRIGSVAVNGNFHLSRDGTLMFEFGGLVGGQRTIAVVEPAGNIRKWSDEGFALVWFPEASRDGKFFAGTILNPNGLYEIWGGELDGRPTLRKLAAAPEVDIAYPIFSPNGEFFSYYRVAETAEDGIYVRKTDGTGTPRKIAERDSSASRIGASSWSPDGKSLLGVRFAKGNWNMVLFPIPASEGVLSEPVDLVASSAHEYSGGFSPDGRWFVYESNESGQSEVYLRSFEPPSSVGMPIPVSAGPGNKPRWSKDGKRIYFVADQRGLMAVDLTTKPRISVSSPELILDLGIQETFGQRYDTLPGGRLLIVQRGELEGEVTRYDVVLNWLDVLEEKMSAQVAAR